MPPVGAPGRGPPADGTRLVLVRHCATAWNEARRYQGHEDIGLSPEGRRMARELGTHLAARGVRPRRVWVSDLRRARETASLALPDAVQEPDPRLRELDFGAFSGATYEENLERYGEAFRRWLGDPDRYPPPDGERLRDLHARVVSWAAALPAVGEEVAVLHVGSLKAALSWALGQPFAAVIPRHLPIGAVVELQVMEGAWRAVRGWDEPSESEARETTGRPQRGAEWPRSSGQPDDEKVGG